jgi:hypothetical protein
MMNDIIDGAAELLPVVYVLSRDTPPPRYCFQASKTALNPTATSLRSTRCISREWC